MLNCFLCYASHFGPSHLEIRFPFMKGLAMDSLFISPQCTEPGQTRERQREVRNGDEGQAPLVPQAPHPRTLVCGAGTAHGALSNPWGCESWVKVGAPKLPCGS